MNRRFPTGDNYQNLFFQQETQGSRLINSIKLFYWYTTKLGHGFFFSSPVLQGWLHLLQWLQKGKHITNFQFFQSVPTCFLWIDSIKEVILCITLLVWPIHQRSIMQCNRSLRPWIIMALTARGIGPRLWPWERNKKRHCIIRRSHLVTYPNLSTALGNLAPVQFSSPAHQSKLTQEAFTGSSGG